jgi:uroporphyrinogen decarboxylase
VLSIDQSLTLATARRRLGPAPALQGNLDPAELSATPARIASRVRDMIDAVEGRGLVVNLGQGVTPDVPVAGVDAFVRAVTAWRPRERAAAAP